MASFVDYYRIIWFFAVAINLMVNTTDANAGDLEEPLHSRAKRQSGWYVYTRHGHSRRSRGGGDSSEEEEEQNPEPSNHRISQTSSTVRNADVYQVRLVGGVTENEGRVEIRKNSGPWGMVCDDDWSYSNAFVVCRMLGYRGVMSVFLQANRRFGTGNSDFLMDDVTCDGSESSLGDCAHVWESHNCNRQEEAAGVTCLIDVIDEDHPECFTLQSGADYRGTVSQTLTGIPCQAWTSQTPHTHHFYPSSFPGFGLGDHNYCRNFGRAVGPWCYTTDPDVEFGYCSLGQKQPWCRNPSSPECYTSTNGSDYRGFVSETEDGHSCISWTDQSTLEHNYTPENFPNQGLGDHSFCRNVNRRERPWCITADPASTTHWGYCDVGPRMPSCAREVPLQTDEANILDSFWIVNGAAIAGQNRRIIINVSPTTCARYCIIEDDFTCRSFDYSTRLNRCWLSDQNSNSFPLTFGTAAESYSYFERINIGATGQFTMRRNQALPGSGTETLAGVSLHACASACLTNLFGCASFDYARESRDCWLNDVATSAGILGSFQDNPYDHFDRIGPAQPDCYTGKGRDYRGFVSSTEDGIMCTNWLTAQENLVGVTAAQYPDGDLGDHNYCRNPDDDKKPWCYHGNTENIVSSWMYCDIPSCESEDPTTPEPTRPEASTPVPENPISLLSEGKQATQSSTLTRYGFSGEAGLALDGDPNPNYRQRSCSSTVREMDGWWLVDLGGVHNVEYIEVVTELDNPQRIRKTEIRVGMIPTDLSTFRRCGIIKRSHADEALARSDRQIRIDCPETLTGRYVRFHMKRRDFLRLCEVRVWGYEGSLTCGARQFLCHSLDACISDTFLCDREEDCSDGSDEASCVYPENLFSEFEDRSLPNTDPVATYRNKLVADCAEICLYELNETCQSFEYNLVQQSCEFFNKTRADTGGLSIMTGYNHYELKSQSNCPTDDENFHPCPSGTCIDPSRLCDSQNDCGDFSDERNCGRRDEYSIQLSNGTAPNEGRLEVNYQGQWGLVCDDDWDLLNADVVCRELGYIRGASKALTVAEFGHGNRGIFFMDDVDCLGTEEALKDCPFPGWGVHDCVLGEAAGVQCFLNEDCLDDQFECLNKNCVDQDRVCDGTPDCGDMSDEVSCSSEIDVRLVNDNSSDETRGRLEVFFRGRWGTVCDTNFEREDALVICKQLGYTDMLEVFPGAHFGRGQGQIVMNDVECTGKEFMISECTFTPGNPGGCTHHNDVSIACSSTQVFPGSCGRRRFRNGAQTRIVGGSSAKHGSWPWQVQLLLKGQGSHLCGGTLIDDRHVLSAAHCFQRYSADDFKVRLGEHDLSNPESSEQDFTIQCVFKHERYDTSTTNNDIILIRLNEKQGKGVVFTPYVRPICLPEPDEFDDGHTCQISGWGNTGDAYPTILQEARVPLLSRRVCTRYNVYGHKLTEKMICAGMLAGGIDTCDGDSGGPLQCENKETGVWKLWGITSWGFGCAQPNAPGVYAKVTEYLDWIERKRSTDTC